MGMRGDSRFEGAKIAPDLRVLDGIAGWCGGLHGSMPIADALKSLAQGFDASAAALSRHLRVEDRPRTVSTYDVVERNSDLPIIGRALASDVMGYLYSKSRPATIWFLTDHLNDKEWSGTQTLSNWQLSRGIKEVAVMILAGNQHRFDYVEFHFERALELSERFEIEALLPTIIRSWAGRKSGLVTSARMDDRIYRARANADADRLKWDAPILGMSNPAKLSRAEFRVCLLLSRGLSVKGLTDELGLSEATVRTHLRSIFAKTQTSSQAELLYRILSSGPESSESSFGTY